jgi:hypothetical protein
MIIVNIIVGLIGIGLGYLSLRYAGLIVDNIGGIGWVEDHVGAGRTIDFYRVLGVIVVIASMLLMFGLLGPTVRGALGFIAKSLNL